MIDTRFKSRNKLRRFGSAIHYHYLLVRTESGYKQALFTDADLSQAIARAEKNKEDCPPLPLFARVVNWLFS